MVIKSTKTHHLMMREAAAPQVEMTVLCSPDQRLGDSQIKILEAAVAVAVGGNR